MISVIVYVFVFINYSFMCWVVDFVYLKGKLVLVVVL